MSTGHECDDAPTKPDPSPYRVRLPGFISNDEIGLGDVVKWATSYIGIKPCGGCTQRAAALNRWMVFTKGQSR